MKNRNRSTILFAGPTIIACSLILLAAALVIFYGVIPYVVKYSILKETQLKEGTATWEKWRDIKIPVLIKFYIFNVTNVEEAERGGKFKLKDIGPYVWEEKRTKDIIAIDEIEDTVTYKEIVYYYFRPDLSVGSPDDELNIVNVPFSAAATLAYKTLYTSLANYLTNIFVETGEKFVIRDVKVRELIFDGVELGEVYGTLADFGVVELPEEFIGSTFALYNQKNGTPSKEFKISRGIKNSQDFGEILEYDNRKELNYWTNPNLPATQQYCNRINGSDGSLVPPFVQKDQRIYLFSPDICRSIYTTFDEEVDFKGIPAYRFTLPPHALANGSLNEENECFCLDPGDGLKNECKDSGGLRMFSCKKNVPIGVSLPHFLHGSQSYHDGVDGMEPNQSKHKVYVIVEPNSGAILKISKKVQIVLELQPIPGIQAFSHARYATVPLFWVEETAEYDEEAISEIRGKLVTTLEIIWITKILVLAFLTLSVISGIVLYYMKERSRQPLLEMHTNVPS